jgi:hypothetical protein
MRKLCKKVLCRKPVIYYSSNPLKDIEGDPLSPPKGEAAQGERPLDPLF